MKYNNNIAFHSSSRPVGKTFLILEDTSDGSVRPMLWQVLNVSAKAAAKHFFGRTDDVAYNDDPTQDASERFALNASLGKRKIWVMRSLDYCFMANAIFAVEEMPRNLRIAIQAIEADNQL